MRYPLFRMPISDCLILAFLLCLSAGCDARHADTIIAGLEAEPPFAQLGRRNPVESGIAECTFKIRNRTTQPITNIKVNTGCGCLRVGDFPAEIRPLEAHELVVKLRVPELPGDFKKTVSLTYGHGDKLELFISGETLPSPKLYSSNTELDFGQILIGESRSRRIEILRLDRARIHAVESLSSSDAITMTELPSASPVTMLMEVTLNASNLADGNFLGNISIHPVHEPSNSVSITCTAKIQDRSTAIFAPPIVLRGHPRFESPPKRLIRVGISDVEITNWSFSGTGELKVDVVTVDNVPFVTVRHIPEQNNKTIPMLIQGALSIRYKYKSTYNGYHQVPVRVLLSPPLKEGASS